MQYIQTYFTLLLDMTWIKMHIFNNNGMVSLQTPYVIYARSFLSAGCLSTYGWCNWWLGSNLLMPHFTWLLKPIGHILVVTVELII